MCQRNMDLYHTMFGVQCVRDGSCERRRQMHRKENFLPGKLNSLEQSNQLRIFKQKLQDKKETNIQCSHKQMLQDKEETNLLLSINFLLVNFYLGGLLFIAAIAALYLSLSLTHSLTGATLGQSPITQSFFNIETSNFHQKFVLTIPTHQSIQNQTKPYKTKPNQISLL